MSEPNAEYTGKHGETYHHEGEPYAAQTEGRYLDYVSPTPTDPWSRRATSLTYAAGVATLWGAFAVLGIATALWLLGGGLASLAVAAVAAVSLGVTLAVLDAVREEQGSET